MNKIIKNKTINKFLICVFIVILLFEILVPTYSFAKTGAEIMNSLRDRCSELTVFDDAKYNEFVKKIKEANENNSVEIVGDKLVINVTSKEDLKNALKSYAGPGEVDTISGNIYSDIVQVNEFTPSKKPDEDDETKTEEEKVRDYLLYNLGMASSSANLILENKKYRIDENGDIKITATADELKSYGVSDSLIQTGNLGTGDLNGEEDEDGADGGILLKPIFAFVNFIADAILAGTQTIMLSDTSPSGFETLVNSITGPFVLMKGGDDSGGTLTSEDAIFDNMKQGSTFTIDNLGHTMTSIQFPWRWNFCAPS